MKSFRALWVILVSVAIVFTAQADPTATARLYSRSLRFDGATSSGSGGAFWRLRLTTISSSSNGELAPDPFGTGYTHSSNVDLDEDLTELNYTGFLELDVPPGADANGNGFPDFFEVSQPVNGLITTGLLQLDGGGTYQAQATWARDAGTWYGTCSLTFADPFYPLDSLNFYHTFQLLEYNGTLSYTPGASTVTGMLSLTDTNLGGTLNGPVVFEKSTSDPHDQLTLQSAALTNEFSQVLSLYAESAVLHDATYATNYFGLVEFDDGDPSTLAPDYYLWQLSIDDTNDTDGDGIPDFSDDVTTVPPTAPTVSIALDATNVWLTISGDVGREHAIESAGSVTATTWTTVRSIVLTNSPQTESLPRPTETTFWRARALF